MYLALHLLFMTIRYPSLYWIFDFDLFTLTASLFMTEKYFDFNDLQCEEYRVKVRFLRDTPWTTEICLAEELSNCSLIPRGTIISLSLYHARILAINGIVAILPSKAFSSRVRADLAADATSVNLRNLALHWYELGIKLSALQPNEDIVRTLNMALMNRLPLLAKAVFAPPENESPAADPHNIIFGSTSFTMGMDHAEEAIYLATVAAKRDADRWLSGH